MKKIAFLFFAAIAVHYPATAQTTVSRPENNPFEIAMVKYIRQMDTAASPATLVSLANSFERIANAEKNKWQPYYYASYCYAAMAFLSDKTAVDALADKAESYLQQAAAIEPNNSEITTLFAMIGSCRILVDPVSRFQTIGKQVQVLLAKAKEQNADNPRIYLLQARMQLRTPEAFGGGRAVAKRSIETALEKFSRFQIISPIAPGWGESQAKNLLEKINAQ